MATPVGPITVTPGQSVPVTLPPSQYTKALTIYNTSGLLVALSGLAGGWIAPGEVRTVPYSPSGGNPVVISQPASTAAGPGDIYVTAWDAMDAIPAVDGFMAQQTQGAVTVDVAPTPVTILPNPNPPPPQPTLFWTNQIFSVVVGLASTLLLDLTADYQEVVNFTLSNPENSPSIWIAYGNPAVVGKGIELPALGFLFEDKYFDHIGTVNAISAGPGTATIGGQVLRVV